MVKDDSDGTSWDIFLHSATRGVFLHIFSVTISHSAEVMSTQMSTDVREMALIMKSVNSLMLYKSVQ